MSMRRVLNRLLKNTGYSIEKMGKNVYSQDGLITEHNHDFMKDPSFCKAFERGELAAGVAGVSRHHWRIHWQSGSGHANELISKGMILK